MYEIVNVQYTGTYSNGGTNIPAVLGEFRATTAADLPAQNVDCHIICGCDGLDIETGDKYIWNGSSWIRQPGTGAFANVYTKSEIDGMITEIYSIIAYYHTTLISDTGEITFYALAGYIGTWKIYGNGQQTGSQTTEFVGVRTANLFDYVSYFDSTFTNYNKFFDYADIQLSANTTYTLSTSYTEVGTSPRNTPFIVAKPNDVPTTASGGISSTSPITITTGSDGKLRLYKRISGASEYPTKSQFDNGEWLMLNLGSTTLPYEPYGYKIPIYCGGQTNNIYLSAPLRKAIDGTDAVDTLERTGTLTRNVDENGDALVTPTTETITVPAIPTVNGQNTLTVDTELEPSRIEIQG